MKTNTAKTLAWIWFVPVGIVATVWAFRIFRGLNAGHLHQWEYLRGYSSWYGSFQYDLVWLVVLALAAVLPLILVRSKTKTE